MKRRRAAALSIALLLPVLVALLFAAMAVRDEGERGRLRAGNAAADRLDAISGRVALIAGEWESALREAADGTDGSPSSLRRLGDRHPWIRQPFLLGPDHRLVFPDASTAGLKETEFLARSDLILAAGFRNSNGEGEAEASAGWTSYWWREGLQWVYWRNRGPLGFVCFELNRYALLSDLSSRLDPSAADRGESESDYRIRILDDKGHPFAEWGTFAPSHGERPLAALELAPPFSGWSLSLDADERTWSGGARLSFAAVVVGAAGLLLAAAALGFFVLRGFAAELREAGQRVSFVNQVSHELKTPLTNIRLYAELLSDRLPEAGAERGYIDVIEREVRRLSRLINNVLTFGRESRGAADRLAARPDSVGAIVERAVDAFRPSFEERGLEIRCSPAPAARVLVDGDLVDQVLGNLLSNAEKYAVSGKSVDIETGRDGEISWIRVRDKGPGIAAADRPRLFRQFERFRIGLTDAVGGTGLGLYLSRRLARAHGGDLVLEPGAEGCSFLFTFKTPTAEEEA